MTETAGVRRREAAVIGLVSFAHLLSHVYLIALPPLFPAIRADLGVGYAELGLIMAIYAVATGALQTPMGFACERLGARPVLAAGLLINGLAIALVAFAGSFRELAALALIAGVGNSVFHPADYSLLSRSVDGKRLGMAFGIHTFGGSAGFAVAPAVMVGLAALGDWRGAMLAVGLTGVGLAAAVQLSGRLFGAGGQPVKARPAAGGVWRTLLTSRPILMFLVFNFGFAAANSGVSQFGVAALTEGYGLSLAAANTALTLYLGGSLVATLPGGWLADRTTRHNLILIVCFGVSSLFIAAIGLGSLPFAIIAGALLAGGALRGLSMSARDVLVRRAAGDVPVGTVFAFVTTGFSVGGAIAPVIYGLLVEWGSPQAVFWASAGFGLICVATVVPERWMAAAATARKASAAAEQS